MPSPKKAAMETYGSGRLKSARIQSKIKFEEDERPPTTGKKGTKQDKNPKMTVMMLAAARKRRLNGEDDDEPVKKTVGKKKTKKTKQKVEKNTSYDSDEDQYNEEFDYEERPMVAVKKEDDTSDDDTDDNLEEETYEGMMETDDILINEEHQYINEIDTSEAGQIEVPAEQMQAELQEEDEENDDEEEDIDENLFFGIPEQQSPDLATCTHCKGKFRKDDVHEHMLSCPERYVQCRECGKILSNLQTLERHHKRFHLKIREVPCTLCDKMFIDEAAARKHLKTVHFKVKNFHCPHCDKSFSQRNKLTYHVRTHSGEKPYSCAECGRSFSLLWNLKTHLRTHTGEKPYSCETCGRRFTQKQNMTSHLTTHRKPKAEKGFRAHFPGELEDYEANSAAGIISGDLTYTHKVKTSYRAFEQAKQLATHTIGGAQYVLGDMQNIEIHTAASNNQEGAEVGLEHGLGLLSSVARKGDNNDVQVDGIVNMNDNTNMQEQVVEVLIRPGDADKSGNTLQTLQGTSNQSKIVIDPTTQNITDGDGREIQLDSNTAAGLSNILQNPDVLAAINNAASTNKFIVIGPVSMFDGTDTITSNVITATNSTFTHDQREVELAANQVSSQTVNDSISATSALAAVESYLQGEQPSSTLNKGDDVVTNILGSMQPDGGGPGPSEIMQSAAASSSVRATNLTICMPSMPPTPLPRSSLTIKADSTQSVMKPSAEVSSSMDEVADGGLMMEHDDELVIDESQQDMRTMEAESSNYTMQINDSNFVGAADSSGLVEHENEASSSSGEPILLLSTDENGQPQIIVKMPDGSETIMSDPALAESLIQVPTITNADNEAQATQNMHMESYASNEMMPDQGIAESNNIINEEETTEMLPDQGIADQADNLPTQSGNYMMQSDSTEFVSQSNVSQSGRVQSLINQSDYVSQSAPHQGNENQPDQSSLDPQLPADQQMPDQSLDSLNESEQQLPDQSLNSITGQLPDQSLDSLRQLPDQSLDSTNVDSTDNLISSSENDNADVDEQTPDSSSQLYEEQNASRYVSSNQIYEEEGFTADSSSNRQISTQQNSDRGTDDLCQTTVSSTES